MDILEHAVKKELKIFFEIREELFGFFDKHIPKKSDNITFDFSDDVKIDAKELYELFYKYDYQARKVFGNTINYFNSNKK